jgi:hypothetical protein
MSQCFRIRFKLPGLIRIDSPEQQLVLAEREAGGEDVILEGRGESIQASSELVVEGRDYGDEDEARAAGFRWRGLLERAFAAVNLGADFGDRAPTGVVTRAVAEKVEAQLGQPVLSDVHGVMTFECEPRPRFVSVGASLGIGGSAEHLAQAIAKAREIGAGMSARGSLAYDLYSASFALPPADARFVMLMMALETLIEPAPRSAPARAHVEHLIALTRQADLPEPEKASIASSLSWLENESISHTGRRLAERLDGRIYMDQTPARFFTRCYELRSRLVHGADPRPAVAEVNAACAPLELFVADLLAGELKDR